jgi:carbonic anhydrase
MADMAMRNEPKAHTPAEAIEKLRVGNERFFAGQSETKVIDAFARRQQIITQTPFAVVLGCSDSRVPVEIVFDQGPGDLFVVRVAGNVAEDGALATVEFAVRYLLVKVVLVLGHQGCSAVQLSLKPWMERQSETRLVRELIESIVPATTDLPTDLEPSERIKTAVQRNVERQVARIKSESAIASKVAAGELAVVGAYYEIETGRVIFLE